MDINKTLASPNGGEIFLFGGENSMFTTTYKGYFVSLEWFVGRRSSEPMMVIQSDRRDANAGALGICLSSIGAWADPSGGPSEGAEQRARDALETLGRANLGVEAHNLLDVVLQFAPHLIAMPPTPRKVQLDAKGMPIWDITRKENGKVVQEVTL